MEKIFLLLDPDLRLLIEAAMGLGATLGAIFLIPLIANRIFNGKWDLKNYLSEIRRSWEE